MAGRFPLEAPRETSGKRWCMNRMRVMAIVTLVVGLMLFITSLVWGFLMPTHLVWTHEQGVEQARASTQLHKLTHEAAHAEVSNKSEAQKEEARRLLAESKKRFEASRAALENAQTMRQRIPFVMRWLGVGLMVLGLGVYLVAKNEAPASSSMRSRAASR